MNAHLTSVWRQKLTEFKIEVLCVSLLNCVVQQLHRVAGIPQTTSASAVIVENSQLTVDAEQESKAN